MSDLAEGYSAWGGGSGEKESKKPGIQKNEAGLFLALVTEKKEIAP